MINVLICDNSYQFEIYYMGALDSEPEFNITFMERDAENAAAFLESGGVDVVVVGDVWGGGRTIEWITTVHGRFPTIPIIRRSIVDNWGIPESVPAGAAGSVMYDAKIGDMIHIIKRCARGETPIFEQLLELPELSEHIIEQLYPAHLSGPTGPGDAPLFSPGERGMIREMFRAGKEELKTVDDSTASTIRQKLIHARYRGWDSIDPAGPIRFVIASEDPAVRQHFGEIVSADSSYHLVTTVDEPELIRQISHDLFYAESDAASYQSLMRQGLPADIVIIGPLPKDHFRSGRLERSYPATPAVIVVTAGDRIAERWDALSSGARSYCPTTMDASDLASEIALFKAADWPLGHIPNIFIPGLVTRESCPLNESELAFLGDYSTGLSIREAAEKQRMSYDEYKVFEGQILARMNSSDIDDAAFQASKCNYWRGPFRPEPTDIEMSVLRLMRDDFSNEQIATSLGITLAEVTAHTKSLYEQLEVNDRGAAIRKAIGHGLIVFGYERWEKQTHALSQLSDPPFSG